MTTQNIKLYLIPGSSSLFPHILLRYCGIPFQPQVVRIAELHKLESINAKQQVPVLVLDGNTITENPAIAHAISNLAPAAHLFGRTPLQFVRVCEWLNWISGPLHAQAWASYIRPWRFTTNVSDEARAAVKAAAEQKVLDRFKDLNLRLHAVGPWAMGDHFTAVDAYIYPFYCLARDKMGLDMQQYSKWSKCYDRILETKALKEVLDDERSWPL